ncbi:DNA invertase [Scytonema hofmannii PCC 7110]|uniref:DNA invertase n=1 Tax=Scytonema hofmannii PCC 7110 TaxID=128403 RepID=A0A139WRQ9_9CYAN|nr:IS607 family transposase [Scytonema hofmannii]KYC35118.1 DNA invertase [Scytonema hofmannii PCC 7110]KYC36947.1 DNA invertase [Scytonema hofmannii PCC 7110]KYC37039.1 DNA invertase [Scytonema hofmannii PCC 7110]KYC38438.1 DNA invertase [Scytonema hofmannii PCC 7110]
MDEYITPGEAARILGVHPQSLRRWEKEEKITAYRTPGNQRRFKQSEIEEFAGKRKPLITVCYARVSTSSQRDDLERQLAFLGERFPEAELVSEVGSGLNFKRKKLRSVLERVLRGNIQKLVVAHPDRLCRFGFELVKWLCETNRCELLVLDNRQLSPEQELVSDMLSIIHCFSSRLYGLRKYRKEIGQDLRQESLQEESKHTAEQSCQDSDISL